MRHLNPSFRPVATTARARNATFVVYLRFIGAFVALNAPHWVLGHWLFISRPIFNVELALPLLLAAWSWRAALPALGVLWVCDLAVSQSRTYRFTSPQAFFASARFLNEIHLAQFFSAEHLLMALPFVAFGALAAWLAPRHRRPFAQTVWVVVVLSALDIANGSSMAWQPGTRLVNANLANAPLTTYALDTWSRRPLPPLIALAPDASATGIAQVAPWANAHPDGSVLIVIVESLGWHVDAGMRSWLRDQLFGPSLASRYQLRETAVPFRGSTTSAELRELCHLQGSYQTIDATNSTSCLPAELHRKGWSTVGLHGFSSHMFDRIAWWPLLGLKHLQFAEELASPADARCGAAFVGVCDSALIEIAVALAHQPRTLVYALTLNSHLPLAPIGVPDELLSRCRAAKTGKDVCMLTATLGVALRSLRTNLSHTGKPPQVVVVGDHAPPFSALSERNQFDQGKVPAFILEPE